MAINITRRITAGMWTIRTIITVAAAEANMVAKPVSQQNRETTTSPVGIDGNESQLHGILSAESLSRRLKCDEPRSVGELSLQEIPQIMESMELSNASVSHEDLGLHMDFISRAQGGVAAAEAYFGGLSSPEKDQYTYEALLNCYCEEKLADKALALFEEMDDMGLVSSMALNSLMTLYMRLDQPEKVLPLVQDMKNRNIPLSSFNYKIWMQSLSQLDDIGGVEQVFEEVTKDNTVNRDWTTYSILPVVYLRAGLHEKAETALKKLENEMQPLQCEAFHFLITMYAATSNLGEVHRIWNVLKSSSETITNCSYDIMLQSLARLKDIDGLTECFDEWDSSCPYYDVRLVHTAIDAYLSSGMEKEAGLILRRANVRKSGPLYIIYLRFATFYLKKWQVDRAMKSMDAAMSEAEEDGWGQNRSCPSPDNVDYIMKYFMAERNVDGAEMLCKLFKKINCLDSKMYGLLLRTYVAANQTEPQMRKRMEEDLIPLDSELEKLLKKVCPE